MPPTFSGAVAGFDGSDVLGLTDVAFGKITSYAANSSNTGGTLTVSDGTHTANIALLVEYMAGVLSCPPTGSAERMSRIRPGNSKRCLTRSMHDR
jgi:hypothetical protein